MLLTLLIDGPTALSASGTSMFSSPSHLSDAESPPLFTYSPFSLCLCFPLWQFRFQLHSTCPPGTKVVAHVSADTCTSCGKHGGFGWYFGPSPEHYRWYKYWTGTSYLGLPLDWNYDSGYVDISIPQYVPKALSKFQHPTPKVPQHSPHLWTSPVYGQKVQLANIDTSPQFDKKGTQGVQAISGTFLYYARAVDPNSHLSERDFQQSSHAHRPHRQSLQHAPRLSRNTS